MTAAVASDTVSAYALRLADDALILSQQLGLWITRAPQLEEELALANIALDLLGQARPLLSLVGDEDELAFLREADEYTNLQLVEQPNGDFAQTMIRQLLFSTFQLARYQSLTGNPDTTIAGVAGKAVKEVSYHREHAEYWVLRLGDGTEESHQRSRSALARLWPFTDEMFDGDDVDREVGTDPAGLRQHWLSSIGDVLRRANLAIPEVVPAPSGGRDGRHTPHLAAILREMQILHRAHPGASW